MVGDITESDSTPTTFANTAVNTTDNSLSVNGVDGDGNRPFHSGQVVVYRNTGTGDDIEGLVDGKVYVVSAVASSYNFV